MTTELTMNTVADFWTSLEESKHWPAIGWAQRCLERPSVVVIGASEADGAETFAVIEMAERRILSEQEFPGKLLDRESPLHWRPVAA